MTNESHTEKSAPTPTAVLGLGKAGSSLANSLLDAGENLVAVYNRGEARRATFLQRHPTGAQVYADRTEFLQALQSAGVELLFLAVPDDALTSLADTLCTEKWLPPNIIHLSGARGADVLRALTGRAHTAAFHPLAALSAERVIPPGALLAIDAEETGLRRKLTELAEAIGLEPASVQRGQHARYHAGAVISANLSVALLHRGIELLRQAGIPEDQARRGLAHLLGSTAHAAREHPLPQMLTGPVARGDAGTLQRHLAALDDASTRSLYITLSQMLVDVASLPAAQKMRLHDVLQEYSSMDADQSHQSPSESSATSSKK